jgi:hypothetical protein
MATITQKIYHNAPEYNEYRTLRNFSSGGNGSFEFEGHRWKYDHTSFDDLGEFDIIFRFDEGGPDITADGMTLFDALLCNAVAGLCANPALYSNTNGQGMFEYAEHISQVANIVASKAYSLARSQR